MSGGEQATAAGAAWVGGPIARDRAAWKNPGLVFQIPCAGQWGNNPASTGHPSLYHPLLVERGWDGFFADAAKRYDALQRRYTALMVRAVGHQPPSIPLMLRLPMGVDRVTLEQRSVISSRPNELGGNDARYSLAAMADAFARHFAACASVMVYVGPIRDFDLWSAVAHSLQRIRAALAPSGTSRAVRFCVDSLGVGPSWTAMQLMIYGGVDVNAFACEPAPIADGFTKNLYGCVLTTANWKQVRNHGEAVFKRPSNVWLITQNGDEKGEGLWWLMDQLRRDDRLSVLVHNDGWDEGIIAGVLGAGTSN
jgi:hypothetical protein